MFGMAIDEDRHIAIALDLLCSSDAGLEALCLRIVAAIGGLHPPRLGHDAASLGRAARVERQRHHLTTKKRIPGPEARFAPCRTRIEAALEGDLGHLPLRFRGLCDHCGLARSDVAIFSGRWLETGF